MSTYILFHGEHFVVSANKMLDIPLLYRKALLKYHIPKPVPEVKAPEVKAPEVKYRNVQVPGVKVPGGIYCMTLPIRIFGTKNEVILRYSKKWDEQFTFWVIQNDGTEQFHASWADDYHQVIGLYPILRELLWDAIVVKKIKTLKGWKVINEFYQKELIKNNGLMC